MLKITEIVLDKGWVSKDKLEDALTASSQTNTKIGEIMIRLGWISEEQLQQALKEQQWRQHGFWVIDSCESFRPSDQKS